MKQFITDAGQQWSVVDMAGDVVMTLPRYAVWGDAGKGKPEVLAVSDHLQELMCKYQTAVVMQIKKGKSQ